MSCMTRGESGRCRCTRKLIDAGKGTDVGQLFQYRYAVNLVGLCAELGGSRKAMTGSRMLRVVDRI